MSPQFFIYLYIIAQSGLFGKGLPVVFAQDLCAPAAAGKGMEKFFKCAAAAEEGGIPGDCCQGAGLKLHQNVQKVCKFFT